MKMLLIGIGFKVEGRANGAGQFLKECERSKSQELLLLASTVIFLPYAYKPDQIFPIYQSPNTSLLLHTDYSYLFHDQYLALGQI